jgi:nucleoside-diphosphate-sugar epimerase
MFAPRAVGGGLLADSGPHVFDMLAHWFGQDVDVSRHSDNSTHGADSELLTELRFADGPTALVELSRLRELPNRCELVGDGGTLTVGTGFTTSYELRDAHGTLVDSGPVPVLGAARTDWVGLFQAQLDNFADAIDGRAEPMATAADGATCVRLIERAAAVRTTEELRRPWEWPSPRVAPTPTGRIAVTGASGFIGSTVVDRVVASGGRATAVVRDISRFARLSHLDGDRVALRVADVLDEDALVAAFEGCAAVVHTVYGSDGDPDRQWAVGVDGTETVVRAAARAGVRRVVHVGTVAVYQDTDAVVDETTPRIDVAPHDRGYGAQKLAAERAAFAAGRAHGIEVVCVQPAVVYGPWGSSWTARPIERIATGAPELPSGGVGVCNAVHVADVADALLFATTERLPAGTTILASAKEPVSWGRFYDAFRELVGQPLPGDGVDLSAVGEWERPLYTSKAVVCVDTATEHGWQPKIGFEEGIAHVGAWARWAGLVS